MKNLDYNSLLNNPLICVHPGTLIDKRSGKMEIEGYAGLKEDWSGDVKNICEVMPPKWGAWVSCVEDWLSSEEKQLIMDSFGWAHEHPRVDIKYRSMILDAIKNDKCQEIVDFIMGM